MPVLWMSAVETEFQAVKNEIEKFATVQHGPSDVIRGQVTRHDHVDKMADRDYCFRSSGVHAHFAAARDKN